MINATIPFAAGISHFRSVLHIDVPCPCTSSVHHGTLDPPFSGRCSRCFACCQMPRPVNTVTPGHHPYAGVPHGMKACVRVNAIRPFLSCTSILAPFPTYSPPLRGLRQHHQSIVLPATSAARRVIPSPGSAASAASRASFSRCLFVPKGEVLLTVSFPFLVVTVPACLRDR